MEQDLNIRIDEQRLDRLNKGTNFFSLNNDYKKKKYYISVMLDVALNLKEKRESIEVDTNLPISEGYWRSGLRIDEFFEKLKNFANRPLGKIIIPNKDTKRCEISSYQFGEIEHLIRDETINFEDIDITIGELAREKLKIDFEKEVKKILDEQVSSNKQEQIDTYVRLKTKIENLKKLLCKESNYGYGYREEKDETIKMPLTAEEYNSKLKEVETELKTIEKEFGLKESVSECDYIKIKSDDESCNDFKEWLADNEEELRNNFESDNDEGMTFDEYAEMCYSESCEDE